MGDVPTAKLINISQYKEQENEMTELRTLVGGSTPPGSNWLSELEIGTIFLAKDKTSADFSLMYLCLIDKTEKSVKLASPELPTPRFVDPNRFCQKYMWHETLAVVKEEDLRAAEDNVETEKEPTK
jgi:hypothetical protein